MTFRLGRQRLVVARPDRGAHRSQRRAIGSEGVQRMQKRAASRASIQRSCAVHLLRRTRQIDLGRILHQQRDILLRHAPPCGFHVRRENVIKTHLFIVKQTIRRDRLRMPPTGRWKARGRVRSQLSQHFCQTLIQSLI
jgi:hypothetical protein